MKKCSTCKENKPAKMFHKDSSRSDGLSYTCKKCRTLINSDPRWGSIWSKNNYPEKYKARYMLNNAIASGKFFKKACDVCGSKKTQGHHNDYSKPLNVEWLCQKHHAEAHDGK